jgi:hypothetical protein
MEISFTPEEEEYIDAVSKLLDRIPDTLELRVKDENLYLIKKDNGLPTILCRTPLYLTDRFIETFDFLGNLRKSKHETNN